MELQETEFSSNSLSQKDSLQSGFQGNSSPIRLNNIQSSPLKTLPNDMQQKNKHDFAKLSSQLTELLNQLSDIYTEIGYSRNDIQKNESSLFESVSATFDKFYNDSITFRDALRSENNKSIECLRSILKIINDPNGTRTIPDLYIRNLITKVQRDGSTLLGIRKNLESSKKYILKDYRQRLVKYLAQAKVLYELRVMIDGFELKNDVMTPSIDTLASLEQQLSVAEDPLDVYQILNNDSRILLQSDHFNDLSDSKFTLLNQCISNYKVEIASRLSKLKALSQEIVGLWNEMCIDYTNEYSMISERILLYTKNDSSDLEVSCAIIEELGTVLESLNSMREERLMLKREFEVKCEELWTKLKQEPSLIEAFKEKNGSLSLDSIEAYSEEYSRLEELKRVFMKDFVLDARAKIEELWNLLCYSDQQRFEFSPFNSETFNDDLLEQHEQEVSRLNAKYELIRPLMDLVQQFKALLIDKHNLEESSKDSSRLLVRNSHKILMEEEKTRKRLARQFPKVIGELRTKLTEFESQGETVSLYLGEEFIQQLDEEQRILESKGRRVVNGAAAQRNISRPASRAPSRPASRAPSRPPSRPVSRAPSKASSPTKPITSTSSIPRQPSQGIQKPTGSFRKPILKVRPVLTTSTSCNLPTLRSPTKNSTLSITSDLIKERKPTLITPSRITRSHSSFQPQLSKLPEAANFGSPKQRTRLSPLKPSNLINSPQRSKYNNNIVTSPLKSLISRNSEEKENQNGGVEQFTSDEETEDVGNDTYSNWREEQLRKLNKSAKSAKSVDWALDTF